MLLVHDARELCVPCLNSRGGSKLARSRSDCPDVQQGHGWISPTTEMLPRDTGGSCLNPPYWANTSFSFSDAGAGAGAGARPFQNTKPARIAAPPLPSRARSICCASKTRPGTGHSADSARDPSPFPNGLRQDVEVLNHLVHHFLYGSGPRIRGWVLKHRPGGIAAPEQRRSLRVNHINDQCARPEEIWIFIPGVGLLGLVVKSEGIITRPEIIVDSYGGAVVAGNRRYAMVTSPPASTGPRPFWARSVMMAS